MTSITNAPQLEVSHSFKSIDKIKIQDVVYVALASLGLALAIGSCFVAPPIALAFGAVATALSLTHSVVYYRSHPEELISMMGSAKYVGYRILGIVSQSFKDKAFEVSQEWPKQQLTARKIAKYALLAGSCAVFIASLFTLVPVSNAVVVGFYFIQWVDYSLINKSQCVNNQSVEVKCKSLCKQSIRIARSLLRAAAA